MKVGYLTQGNNNMNREKEITNIGKDPDSLFQGFHSWDLAHLFSCGCPH